MNVDGEVPEAELFADGAVVAINRGRLFDAQAEHRALLGGRVVEELIVLVQEHRDVESALCRGDARDVIEMRVREQDSRNAQAMPPRRRDEVVDAVTGIDDDALSGSRASEDESVRHERRSCRDLENHVLSHAHGDSRIVWYGLATHALGRFHVSFWGLGPTELRILLAIGTVRRFWGPDVTIMGDGMRMFDLGAWVGAAGLLATAIVAAAKHTRELYIAEPRPQASPAEFSLTMRR